MSSINTSIPTNHRINFCQEYVVRSEDVDGTNILNMKRAIAESYFELGQEDEGETLFKEITAKFPTWGWGWIGWSDQYWIFAKEKNKNSEKAIHILQQALDIEGLEDRFDVLDRLSDIYTDLGMTKEAKSIKEQSFEEVSPLPQTSVSVKRSKIGRNEPCPCGSGLKYKKCCGK